LKGMKQNCIERSLHGLNSTDLYLKYEIEFSTSKSAL
jgi:hypothetical protein